MQTSQTEPPTREEIEAAIEAQKEAISEERYELRWLIRGCWGLPLSLAVCGAAAFLGWLFPAVSTPADWVIGAGALVAIACIAGFFAMYSDYEKFIQEHRGQLREGKRELEKLQRSLAYFDEHALKHLTPEQYMHQLPKLVTSYRKQADRYRNRFIVIQITTILLSASITSLSGGWLDRYFAVPWVIPVMSAIISILTSFTLFFKFREKGANLQQTANAMDWEHMACTLGIGQYEGLNRVDALRLLAKTGEALRKEQQQRQIQLEQSSHAEQKALQSNT